MVGETVFDLLAELCAMLTKEEERRCAIRRVTVKKSHIKEMNKKYESFLKMILNSQTNEYKFNNNELFYINGQLQCLSHSAKDEIFHLVVEIEQGIEEYSGWLEKTVFHSVPALNKNWRETNIKIYPKSMPQWSLDKSERGRQRVLNSYLKNYMIVRVDDLSPFQLDVHYWNDTGLLKETESGWVFSVALSPIMNNAVLLEEDTKSEKGYAVTIQGIKNSEEVTQRTLHIFDQLFPKQYSMIIFTEGLGTEQLVEEVKKRMRMHPDYCTIVLLPTICMNEINRLVVLGPGGTECLHHDKAAPFILYGKDGIARREQLRYVNSIPVLITKELGMIVFPICAEFLDPDYYRAMTEDAMANTVICPSLSPGIGAFVDTMAKGTAMKLLQIYINTCSARAVSRREQEVPEPLGMVQLPFSEQNIPLNNRIERNCGNICSKETCFFDIRISYKDEMFYLEKKHYLCA